MWPSAYAALDARAVRDHLADLAELSVTLPALRDRGAAASIHCWFANCEGVREALYAVWAAQLGKPFTSCAMPLDICRRVT
jgi:hypothetical protein